ncbi:MAG: beta-aspartyl-peptidase [Planctomycetota bacterium]|nr:MAG: beta-aspartyl-peptidase [Planctomycetota bacterium]
MNDFVLCIHGGAGQPASIFNDDRPRSKYLEVLKQSIEAGKKILEKNGSAIEAVEASINVLENCPLFNSGFGSALTHEGIVEMDASFMNGQDLSCGAIASVKYLKNPISGARLVMEKSPHVLLVGDGADQYCQENGMITVTNEELIDDFRKVQLEEAIKNNRLQLDHHDEHDNSSEKKYGTVGAVALDKHGNLAAGTSTGGMTNKHKGRVGDSPLIGAGTYANNKTCAISSTGHGEAFMRMVTAYDVSAQMEYAGKSLKEATDFMVHQKLPEIEGKGGLISIDKDGNFAMPFNTPGMFRGIATKTSAEVFIE